MQNEIIGSEFSDTTLEQNLNEEPLRSEIVQEIVSRKPGFAERWALPIFLLILLLLITSTRFISYPDVILGSATITSINAPKEIKTKTQGRLIKINIVESQQVQAQDIIGLMESTANHYEVINLSKLIDSTQILLLNNKSEVVGSLFSKQYLHLGEIQQAYQSFIQSFQLFKQYLLSGFYVKKKTMLQNDMNYIQRLNSALLQQQAMQKEDVELSQESFKAIEKLEKEKVISLFDYRTEKSKLIGKQLMLPQITSEIINNESIQYNKKKEISELDNQILQQKNIFVEALNTLKAQVDDWKAKYLLTSPISGRVSFTSFLQENQELRNNQSVCFVNPVNTEYYAELIIPQKNFGKIKKGQKVLLKFLSYPFEEFGSVEGRLDFISPVPSDSGYLAKVVLPAGLITNYKTPLQFINGMQANAQIVTSDISLFERLLHQINKTVEKR